MPKAPMHGGSTTLASVGNAVVMACQTLRDKLSELAGPEGAPRDVQGIVALLSRHGLQRLQADGEANPGEEIKPLARFYAEAGRRTLNTQIGIG